MIRFLDWFIRSYLFGRSFGYFFSFFSSFLSLVAVSLFFCFSLFFCYSLNCSYSVQTEQHSSVMWIVDIYMFTMNGISTQYHKSCGILFSYRLYLIAVYLHIYAYCQLTFLTLNITFRSKKIIIFLLSSEFGIGFISSNFDVDSRATIVYMIFDPNILHTNQW